MQMRKAAGGMVSPEKWKGIRMAMVGDPKAETKWRENSGVWAVILKCDFDANLAGQAAAPPGISPQRAPVASLVT